MSLTILQSVDVISLFQRSFLLRKLLTHFTLLLSNPQNVRHQFIDVGHFFTFALFEVETPSFIGLKSNERRGFDGHPLLLTFLSKTERGFRWPPLFRFCQKRMSEGVANEPLAIEGVAFDFETPSMVS
jgi:hypothetical protein